MGIFFFNAFMQSTFMTANGYGVTPPPPTIEAQGIQFIFGKFGSCWSK